MLLPDLPQPWLSKIMRNKFPNLCSWTEALSASVFGPEVTLGDAFPTPSNRSEKTPSEKAILPWKAPDDGGVIGVGGVFLSGVADAIPILGQLRRNTRMRQHGGKTPEDEQSSSWQTLTLVSGLIASVGLMVGYAFHSGLISLSANEEAEEEMNKATGLGSFGEAGAALMMYADQMDTQVRIDRAAEAGPP
jgi:sorting and assembly machinery component 37